MGKKTAKQAETRPTKPAPKTFRANGAGAELADRVDALEERVRALEVLQGVKAS